MRDVSCNPLRRSLLGAARDRGVDELVLLVEGDDQRRLAPLLVRPREDVQVVIEHHRVAPRLAIAVDEPELAADLAELVGRSDRRRDVARGRRAALARVGLLEEARVALALDADRAAREDGEEDEE